MFEGGMAGGTIGSDDTAHEDVASFGITSCSTGLCNGGQPLGSFFLPGPVLVQDEAEVHLLTHLVDLQTLFCSD